MGKIKDTIDWFMEKAKATAEKTKDTFGTGIEALKVSPETMGFER